MILNWLDMILLGILMITFIIGVIKGLVKQIIGIVAVIVGLILALVYYPHVAGFFARFISGRTLTHFLGFLAIFLGVLCIGELISAMLSKLMKGSLKFVDHVLGGGLGLLKGILICGVILFALLVFPVNFNALKNSQLSPYCLKITRAVYYIIPQDLKERFSEAYNDIVGREKKDGKRV